MPWDYTVKSGMWDYPVKPGTEEWKQFQTYDEMVKACQIPDGVLASLSTDDLTELCLRYPLYTDFLVFENPDEGFDRLFNNFNGIRELYKRADVATCLNKQYSEKVKSLSSFLNEEKPEIEKGIFVINISVYEFLLSRVEQKQEGQKNTEGLKEVLQSLVTGYERKMQYHAYFSGLFQTNFYARAQVILMLEPSSVERFPQKENNGTLRSGAIDVPTIRVIDELSYQLIK
jgi:hypothetical protein